jgi:MOSC domain-containing protein YiiM
MRVATIAVGEPRTVSWQGGEVVTSIFKAPVAGPVMARGNNLQGDRQSDPRVHGGEFKAV